ncbi:MAG: YigZ family protein [Bacteroidales bacterium]|nr:YigZ family protein [Bacteroidales bacterium]
MEKPDSYTTIAKSGEGLYKDKGSKFLSFAFHIETEDEADDLRRQFKKKYYDATHVVYAFRLGAEGEKFRAADDGEPSGSSGMPVYNTIRSKNLTDVIVLVVRYFGGTKLGIPGLIDAYSQAAALALDNAETVEKTITQSITVEVPYSMVNFVMRVIKDNSLTVSEMSGDTSCRITIAVPLNQSSRITEVLNQNGKITVG